MNRHILDFQGFTTNESESTSRPMDRAWVLYYWENYEPNFLSVHPNEQDARLAFNEAVVDRYDEQIDEWIYENMPRQYQDQEDFQRTDPRGYSELFQEAIDWAADEYAYDIQFVYEPLKDLMNDNDHPEVFAKISKDMMFGSQY